MLLINKVTKVGIKMLNDEKIYCLLINDKLGTHAVCASNFVVKCKACGKERQLIKRDTNENEIKPVRCECGGENKFVYWLDGLYTEEEFKELEKKTKN